ncbi:MAG TPA: hypothetical protein VNP37_00720 [Actinomycetospora sp.]|nr:hypothetical protein [Actinomycetospora sp.]
MGATLAFNARKAPSSRVRSRADPRRHPDFGRRRWRDELTPTDAGGTRATETFDWSTSLGPALFDRTSVPAMNARSIEETLPRLKELAESWR